MCGGPFKYYTQKHVCTSTLRREETRAAAELEKNNIENESKKRKQIANIADKYSSASGKTPYKRTFKRGDISSPGGVAHEFEEEFKKQTV